MGDWGKIRLSFVIFVEICTGKALQVKLSSVILKTNKAKIKSVLTPERRMGRDLKKHIVNFKTEHFTTLCKETSSVL